MVLRIEDPASKEGMLDSLGDKISSMWDMRLHIYVCIYGELGCTGFSI